MKVKNSNNSSIKTRKLIKDAFIALVSEKREIANITVKELVERANISRATFYAHFDDIYSVVGEFESELIDEFFTNAKLLATDDYEKFFLALFTFMKQNNENYKMMCRTNEFLFSASRLSALVVNKFTELCNNDRNIKDRKMIDIDISVFVEGVLCEYVRYCRGISAVSLEDLYEYMKDWYKKFMKTRCA